MIEIKLPFWLAGTQLNKLVSAAVTWWGLVESWVAWTLTQFDELTCSVAILDLLAYQRDVQRFASEPLDLYRKRVKFALINAQDAGSKAGFIAIFERLGIGTVTITERFDAENWDVINLELSDQQLSDNADLLMQIIYKYGRTCRRYTFSSHSNTMIFIAVFECNHVYSYDIARL